MVKQRQRIRDPIISYLTPKYGVDGDDYVLAQPSQPEEFSSDGFGNSLDEGRDFGSNGAFDTVKFNSKEDYSHFLEVEGMEDPVKLYENVTGTRYKFLIQKIGLEFQK